MGKEKVERTNSRRERKARTATIEVKVPWLVCLIFWDIMGYSNLLLPILFTMVSILSILIISLIIYMDLKKKSKMNICVDVFTHNISNIILGPHRSHQWSLVPSRTDAAWAADYSCKVCMDIHGIGGNPDHDDQRRYSSGIHWWPTYAGQSRVCSSSLLWTVCTRPDGMRHMHDSAFLNNEYGDWGSVEGGIGDQRGLLHAEIEARKLQMSTPACDRVSTNWRFYQISRDKHAM